MHRPVTASRSDRFSPVDLSPLLPSPPDSSPSGGAPPPGRQDQEKEDSRRFRRTVGSLSNPSIVVC